MSREQRLYSVDAVHSASDAALHLALTKSAPVFHLKPETIHDARTKDVVYEIKKSIAPGSLTHRPLLTITNHGADIGSVEFKTLHSGIKISVHNKHSNLTSNSLGQYKYHFAPTCDDKLRWCWAESQDDTIVLIHEQLHDTKIATINKRGILEFADEYDAKWVDDVVVSAVGVWYKDRGLDVGDSKIGEKIESFKASMTG